AVAYEHNVWAALAIAVISFFTAYYMGRLFVVTFLGSHRTELAGHAHESPPVMTGPLILLAIPTVIIGFPPIAGLFVPGTEEHGSAWLAILTSALVLVGGAYSAFVLYRGKDADPISIPLFANRFYIDQVYNFLIRWTQDLLANISAF